MKHFWSSAKFDPSFYPQNKKSLKVVVRFEQPRPKMHIFEKRLRKMDVHARLDFKNKRMGSKRTLKKQKTLICGINGTVVQKIYIV